MKRSWLVDAVGVAVTVLMLYPELSERRVWAYVGMRITREAARRCGQLAIVAENVYRQETER